MRRDPQCVEPSGELAADRPHQFLHRAEPVQIGEPLAGGDDRASFEDSSTEEEGQVPPYAALAHPDARHDFLNGELAGGPGEQLDDSRRGFREPERVREVAAEPTDRRGRHYGQ